MVRSLRVFVCSPHATQTSDFPMSACLKANRTSSMFRNPSGFRMPLICWALGYGSFGFPGLGFATEDI